MVVIRLARGGAKKRPFFNVVVADSRNRRDGRFIERVGFYNPIAAKGEEALRLAVDRIAFWQDRGAQLSDTVAGLVKRSREARAAGRAGRLSAGSGQRRRRPARCRRWRDPRTPIVVMGEVLGPYGIRGWLKVRSFAESPDALLDYRDVVAEARARVRPGANSGGRTGACIRACWSRPLDGVDTREAALAMKGFEIGVPRATLPAAAEGEFYWDDLTGLAVLNRVGCPAGRSAAGLPSTARIRCCGSRARRERRAGAVDPVRRGDRRSGRCRRRQDRGRLGRGLLEGRPVVAGAQDADRRRHAVPGDGRPRGAIRRRPGGRCSGGSGDSGCGTRAIS